MQRTPLQRRMSAERKLHRFLQENHLMFIRVGGKATDDRVLPVYVGDGDEIGDEYDGVLRAIVALLC